MELIFKTFKHFGLACHVGRDGAKSKTEAMYFPPAQSPYQDANTLPLDVDGGIVTFTQTFKYLGSLLTSDLCDSIEVDARIRSASAAFASLRQQFLSSKNIKPSHKARTYESLILGLLLYGSETWSLTNELKNRLQSFHNRCVRTMCRINLWHTREYHIHGKELEERLGLKSLDTYLTQRRLKWAGHVYRMEFNRLPRKLLTSWVDHPRPRGRPRAHYGHGLARDLKTAGLDVATWHQVAANRPLWHKLIDQNDICVPKKQPIPLSTPSSPQLLLSTSTPPLPLPTPELALPPLLTIPSPTPQSTTPTPPPPHNPPVSPPHPFPCPPPAHRCSARPSAARARQAGHYCIMADQLRRKPKTVA